MLVGELEGMLRMDVISSHPGAVVALRLSVADEMVNVASVRYSRCCAGRAHALPSRGLMPDSKACRSFRSPLCGGELQCHDNERSEVVTTSVWLQALPGGMEQKTPPPIRIQVVLYVWLVFGNHPCLEVDGHSPVSDHKGRDAAEAVTET
ncbi:unnamed protein product [Taenia asiatica]|uniref:Uncharacterized protein n=1 Tax=Taenia asiatica TaxID=60517 RepID=A0A0R3WGL3_TAEAS|nr:unnamed protein product [Taenia asiatica]